MGEFKLNHQWCRCLQIFDLAAGLSCVVGSGWVRFPGCIPTLTTCCLLPSHRLTWVSDPSWGSRCGEPSLPLACKTKYSASLAQTAWNEHNSFCWASFRRIILILCYESENKIPSLLPSPPPKTWEALKPDIFLLESHEFAFPECLSECHISGKMYSQAKNIISGQKYSLWEPCLYSEKVTQF